MKGEPPMPGTEIALQARIRALLQRTAYDIQDFRANAALIEKMKYEFDQLVAAVAGVRTSKVTKETAALLEKLAQEEVLE